MTTHVDGYLVSAPSVLRAGQTQGVTVSLLSGQRPAAGDVRLSLTDRGRTLAQAHASVSGTDTIALDVPADLRGSYMLEVEGPGFHNSAPLKVADGTVIFVETDKPIYKPGQDIHVRVLRVDAELRPLAGDATVEIMDAKGIRIFRALVSSDDYGMATVTMPLSTEPNLGVWKVTAEYGEQSAQVDVRVEQYVLPKYEVNVELPKGWVLADEKIEGTVSAEYSFGKPVRGELEIVASRYVGKWEQFATFSREIDGSASFGLPAVLYVAGVPASGGQGNVTLDVTVREESTGYEERTTQLLTVAESPVNVRLIAESPSFKPTLPFSVLLVTETPDNLPVDRDVSVHVVYLDTYLLETKTQEMTVSTSRGRAIFSIDPPSDAVGARITANTLGTESAVTELALQSSHSPSGNFVHVEQTGAAGLSVGDLATFRVHSTRPSINTYYEVIARGNVVFSEVSDSPLIEFPIAPLMAPSSRLVVYQIMPDNEVAADFIPFNVTGQYPGRVEIDLGAKEVRPGEQVDVRLNTDGRARVGLAAVDRSVFILSENRLNLQQVFAELERLYMQPQVELHDVRPVSIVTRGAVETFRDAGLVVMSNKSVPEGENYKGPERPVVMMAMVVRESTVLESAPVAVPAAPLSVQPPEQLAEVQRVRQFFPETWLWTDLVTDSSGNATLTTEAPDSITTWMFRAVSLSKEHGLGVAEAELRVFQPFFLQVDLPYSGIRGEEFPVKVALYNYLETRQEFFVELQDSDRYQLLDEPLKSVTVPGGNVGGVEFNLRLTDLGSIPIQVTARSLDSADAVIKDLLVEPEGVAHETVDNAILSGGDDTRFATEAPFGAVPGSARTQIAITGSYLSQTLEGLENLLRMPFGCGEQNMILLAPNVFVARYLQETGQLKPEVMARAEHLMTTGYQRELTYRRADGSFSAFGDSDNSGSLWLTAFVLKTFAQADGLIYMDDAVLRGASDWIMRHQRPDGSFEPVGFLHHQELLGGLRGNTALTAYIAIALLEAGHSQGAASAVSYLERQLDGIDDPYTMAIVSYALALADSGMATTARERLLSMATTDPDGLYWGEATDGPRGGTSVETTGYAVLALLELNDRIPAASGARWLVSQRNPSGGFGSTQDTVVGLQALIEFAANAKFDVDMTVNLTSGAWTRQVRVNQDNADVVQIFDVPAGESIQVLPEGEGEVVVQVVNRFNLPDVEVQPVDAFRIDVEYSADNIEVDDRIQVAVEIEFNPPIAVKAGMVVVDVSIPTGFAPVSETVQALVEEYSNIKRREIAGRKVILYIEDMVPNESLSFEFEAVAVHPVQAQPVTSQVYAYYSPHMRAEHLGQEVSVSRR